MSIWDTLDGNTAPKREVSKIAHLQKFKITYSLKLKIAANDPKFFRCSLQQMANLNFFHWVVRHQTASISRPWLNERMIEVTLMVFLVLLLPLQPSVTLHENSGEEICLVRKIPHSTVFSLGMNTYNICLHVETKQAFLWSLDLRVTFLLLPWSIQRRLRQRTKTTYLVQDIMICVCQHPCHASNNTLCLDNPTYMSQKHSSGFQSQGKYQRNVCPDK